VESTQREPSTDGNRGVAAPYATHSRRALLGIFLVAIALRFAALAYFRAYDITPQQDHFEFGYEAGRIARSLATGQGFSSPMPEPTGPTAFLAPGFPVIMAGIFKIFGVYTAASAVAIYALDVLLSALTCLALYALGVRIFGPPTALLSALFFALYPPSIFLATASMFDATLSALAFVTLMLALFALPAAPTLARLAGVGLFMGVVVLINPVVAIIYPAVVVWVWCRLGDSSTQPSNRVQGVAVLTAACFLVFIPWMIRNAVVVGEFSPRSTVGVQLRLTNNEYSWQTGLAFLAQYPANSAAELKLYQEMGEAAYDRYCARIAFEFMRANPRKVVDIIVRRIFDWWTGMNGGQGWNGTWNLSRNTGALLVKLRALFSVMLVLLAAAGCIRGWRKGKPVRLLVTAVLIFPVPYYFLIANSRYRFPTDSFLLLFATYAIVELASALRKASPEAS
jgi:4-amino-4-deoxy-L-arabinose transferase-like glycosyltransferase